MTARNILNKSIILGVFVLAGYLLARSVYYMSIIGIICAIIAIVAWTRFLVKLTRQQEDKKVLEELLDDQ